MLVLRRRRAVGSAPDRPVVPSPEPAVVAAFLDELQTTMKPMIRPVRELQAANLGVDIDVLQWLERRPEPLSALRAEQDTWAEVFVLDDGLLVISARRTVRENPEMTDDGMKKEPSRVSYFTLTAMAVASTVEAAEQALEKVSAIAQSKLGVELTSYFARSEKFESIRSEVVAEDLPDDSNVIAAANALADRPTRSLAISIKSSRGLLTKDISKLVRPETAAPGLIENLITNGLAIRDVVVVCSATQTQVARVPDRGSLAQLAGAGLRCACGKPIDQESSDDLLTVTDLGVLMLDKSRWMSILVREDLAELGVLRENILLECQLGADEIDCIALIGSEMAVFELKDKEFSTGNAYSFSAKISLIDPDFSIIVTTDKVASDVKGRFSRPKRDARGRVVSSSVDGASIQYVEGDDFRAGLKRAISEIYQVDSRRFLQNALESAILQAGSVLSAVSGRMDSASSVLLASQSTLPDDQCGQESSAPISPSEPEAGVIQAGAEQTRTRARRS